MLDLAVKYKKGILVSTYLLSSMFTTVINKYVVSVIRIQMIFFYLGVQSFIITLILFTLSLFNLVHIRRITLNRLLLWLPCSILLTLMIYTGAKSMEVLPISLFTLFKNFSIILIAIGENFLYNIRMDRYTLVSFLCMLISSSISEYSDFVVDLYGMIWILLNITSSASYIILFKYVLDTEKASNNECIFYNNLLSIPCLLLCSLLFEKIDSRLLNLNRTSLKILGISVISSLCAFFIAYSTTLILKNLSSTTFAFLGAMNKLLVSFSGIVFIGEKNVNIFKISSIVLGSLGSLVYIRRIKKE